MTKELIEEARRQVGHIEDKSKRERLISDLADALEAATRVPVQGEPNDDRETLVKILEPVEALIEGAETLELGYEAANAILAAGFSRAAVPDAATEAAVAEGDQCIDQAMKRVEALEAERDAAVAAIERVWGLHQMTEVDAVTGDCADEECEHEGVCPTEMFEVCAACWNLCESADPYFGEQGIEPVLWPCPTVAALDGVPEPDNDDPCDAEVYSWDHYRPSQIDSYWIRCTLLGKHDEHEDSHTGLKWRSGLPVEGESTDE